MSVTAGCCIVCYLTVTVVSTKSSLVYHLYSLVYKGVPGRFKESRPQTNEDLVLPTVGLARMHRRLEVNWRSTFKLTYATVVRGERKDGECATQLILCRQLLKSVNT